MPSQGWICYQRTKWDQSSEVSTADQSGSSIFRLLLLIFRLLSTFPALALSVRLSSNILQKRPTKLSESNNIPKTRKRLWRWRFNSIFVFPPRNALSYWSNAIHALPDPRRRSPPRERKKGCHLSRYVWMWKKVRTGRRSDRWSAMAIACDLTKCKLNSNQFIFQ